ncbi:mechanosensitive ion channel domain-containing protein [Fluviicola sp.]|uniref:mechanosensitive ion channel family protein n=1 Tax=Fluviicola sp. TaxID=1917219 RepID=UPI0031DD4045
MNETLFWLGPYAVCMWNILIIAISFFGAYVLRKIFRRSVKRYLTSANIHLEGRKATWFRLLSQSGFALAGYISVMSFNINNESVTFGEFLDYNFIDTSKIKISFGNVALVILIIFLSRVVLNIVRLFIQRRFQRAKRMEIGTEYIYIQVAKYIIAIMAFVSILAALDVDAKIFLGGSAALLVGIGLGLQDVFKDMFSGLVLLFEGSIRVGDVVEINDGKSSEPMVAKIIRINVRTTQIETRDGNVLIVPNAKLTQEYIENWSHGSTLSRFRIPVTVAFGSDTQLVTELLKQAVLSHPLVNKSSGVSVRLNDFGENGLKMEVIFWADQSWDISICKSEIRFEIDRLFRHYQIRIPYPQRDIRVSDNKNETGSSER